MFTSRLAYLMPKLHTHPVVEFSAGNVHGLNTHTYYFLLSKTISLLAQGINYTFWSFTVSLYYNMKSHVIQ